MISSPLKIPRLTPTWKNFRKAATASSFYTPTAILNPYASPMCQLKPRTSLCQTLPPPPDAASVIQFRRPTHHTRDLIPNFNNFERSAAPSRILFFRHGSWIDFPSPALDALLAQFVAGRTAFELAISGRLYTFNFFAMLQVDVATGASHSIAWIDVAGRCFFPASAVDIQKSSPLQSPECDLDRLEGSGEASTSASSDEPRWIGTEALGVGERSYKFVEKKFLMGFRRFAPSTVVTSIHKCSRSCRSGASRLKTFELQVQMTKAARNDANVRFGWYGASSEQVAAIVAHGFGHPNCICVGSASRGVGVHLSAAHCPYLSAFFMGDFSSGAGVNDGDERHMVLCRVIAGKQERIEAGCSQYHPSSNEFDSGVDDCAMPRCYVVWSTHMNTHLLPECIVTYKCSMPQTATTSMNSGRGRLDPNQLFSLLLLELGRYVPPSMIRALQTVYKQYKERRISKEALIRYMRSTVGDKVLLSTVRKIRRSGGRAKLQFSVLHNIV